MKKFIWVLFITMLFTSPIQSQKRTDANIVGHVISNNEHVPFATIFIKGTTYGASTDETGHYMLVNLPVGTHLIKAQAIGFKPVEKEITIKSGETKEVNFILEEDILNLEEIVITADRSEMKRTESVTIVNTLSPRLLSSVQSVALIEGLVGGALVVFAIPFFDKIKTDDPVGALSVHLVAGIWGTLAVGIFNPEVALLAQIKGIVIIGAFVFITSFIVWKVLDLLVGLRVDVETEVNGLDIHETGLEAYPEFKRA